MEEPGEKKTAKFEYRSMAQCCISIWAQKNQTKIEITGKGWKRTNLCQNTKFSIQEIGAPKKESMKKQKNRHKAPDQDGTMLYA